MKIATLGRVDFDGAPDAVEPLLAQPKRIALLLYLLLARPRGLHRRDKLVTLFWPDLGDEAARNALSQALYALRRSLGSDAVVTRGTQEVGLATNGMECDAVQFEQLLEAGDQESAVALYQGSFLASFHVPQAGGFEEWAELERMRLRDRHLEALESLGDAAEIKGDWRSSIRWRKSLYEQDPLNGRHCAALVRSLGAVGERAAALKLATDYARRFREETGTEPGDEVSRAVALSANGPDLLQRGFDSGPESVHLAPGQQLISVGPRPQTPESTPETVARTSPIPAARRRSRSRAVGLAAGMSVVIVAAVALWWRRAESAIPTRVAVFPFSVQDPALSYLREGAMDLLSHAIDGAGVITAVDPQVLLMRIRAAGDSQSPDLATASRVAQELGAERFVLGRVVPSGDSVQILMSLYLGRNPTQPERQFARDGPLASTSTLITGLARDLLLAIPTGPGNWVTEANAPITASYAALREYARGQAALRGSRFGLAAAAFRAAIKEDSTFALAWMGLSEAGNFSAQDTTMVAAIDRALELADRLSPRDRLMVEGLHAGSHGNGHLSEEKLLRVVSTYPNYSEAWFNLAGIRFWHAWRLGRDPTHVKDDLARARALDPQHKRVLHLSAWVAALEGDRAASDSFGRMLSGRSWVYVPEDPKEIAALFDTLPPLRLPQLLVLSEGTPSYMDQLTALVRIPLLLTDSAGRSREERSLGYLLQGYILAAAGQWSLAEGAFDRADDNVRGVGVLERGWLAALPFLRITADRRRAIRDSLRQWETPQEYLVRSRGWEVFAFVGRYLPPPWLVPHAREYVAGLLSAGLGDEAAAAQAALALLRAKEPADSIGLLRDFSFEIRALSAMTRGDSATGLALLDSVGLRVATHYQPFESSYHLRHMTRLLRAEALAARGQLEPALGWFAGLAWTGPPGFVLQAHAHLRRGELLEKMGDSAAAMRQYRRFVTRWQSADSALLPSVQAAQLRMMALEAAAKRRT